MRFRLAAHLAALVLLVPAAGTRAVLRADQDSRHALLASPPIEHYLEALRQQAGIPGLSAAVVQDGQLIWERGFGFQNLESRIRATPDTPYHVGGLMQSLAAVLILQCVEQRHLQLDAPVRQFGLTLPEERATLRHVLSHSSAEVPGSVYRFAPERYAQLGVVMERCAPQAYRKSVAHRLLERLVMRDSVPGADLQNPAVVQEGLFDPADLERYRRVLERVAVPYRVDGRKRATRADPPPAVGIDAANGLITTVRDLAEFDKAVDSSWFLRDETRVAAWTPLPSADGTAMPTGLGWFVQRYRDEPVVWQYGHLPDAYSAMMIKLPARRVTLILLANSNGLAVPFELEAGDVTRSLFATLFLRLFIP
jgi:CubicO group peptidase (beta-lactamase class C family)